MQYLPVGQEVPVITLKTKLILTAVAFFVVPLRFEDGSFLQRTYKNFVIKFEGKGDGGGSLEYVKNIQISNGVSWFLTILLITVICWKLLCVLQKFLEFS